MEKKREKKNLIYKDGTFSFRENGQWKNGEYAFARTVMEKKSMKKTLHKNHLYCVTIACCVTQPKKQSETQLAFEGADIMAALEFQCENLLLNLSKTQIM